MTQSVSSTAACDSVQVGLCQLHNRGLHLDFDVLRWSKMVEIWGTQNETKNSPQLNVSRHLRTATAPRKQLQPAKSGTLLMGCVRASGAPDSSRRQPETTHEVFS